MIYDVLMLLMTIFYVFGGLVFIVSVIFPSLWTK